MSDISTKEAPSIVTPAEAPPQYSAYNATTNSGQCDLPIVIPQSTNLFYIKTFSPFARCYSPTLANLQNPISESELLAFIDRLNHVFLSLPAFQAAHIAGGALLGTQVLPAQAVGGVLQVVSVLASAGTSFVRVRKFMKTANVEIFAPRGLIVKLHTTKKMMERVGFTGTDADGKLRLPPLETVTDLGKYSSESCLSDNDNTSPTAVSLLGDPRLLRLQALEGYIAPLTFDVAEQAPESVFSKYSQAPLRWMNKKRSDSLVKAQAKSLQKRESKAGTVAAQTSEFDNEINDIEKQIQMLQREEVSNVGDTTQKSDEIEACLVRKQVEIEKRDIKLNEIYKTADKKVSKAYKREERTTNRILWIVIEKIGENGSEQGNTEDLFEHSNESTLTI